MDDKRLKQAKRDYARISANVWAAMWGGPLIEALEAAWVENERLRGALHDIMAEHTSPHSYEQTRMCDIAEAALAGGPQ